MSETPKAKTRRVVVDYDYLDGIQGVSVRQPSEFDREVSVVDAALLAEYEAAAAALAAVEKRLLEAAEASKRRNRSYKEFADA